MFLHCKVVILILALSLDGRVQTGQIFGGHKAKPHSRPYMVLLEQRMQNGETTHCDGFLLNEEFVMTAAHCQTDSSTALLGVHDMHHDNQNEIQRISVEKAFPHEDYNRTSYINDVMLLKLSSTANFNDKVTCIDLAEPDNGSLPKSCLVSGWGVKNSSNPQMSPVLMEVNVTLIEQCPKENSYCSQGDTGPGSGDSGGPLVCENRKAYGVVLGCLTPSSGGPRICAFTKISVYRSWINKTMELHGKVYTVQ